MQYTENILVVKNENFRWKNFDIFLIFAQNIDCGYTLEPLGEAVLTSTHNLCFGAKIGIPLHTPVFMPPTLKKLEGHIAFGLSVCVSVCVLTFEW